MKFSCPHCSQHIEADAAWIGHSIPCPSCNRAFTVSAPSSEPPAQPPPGKPTSRPWKAGLALLVAAATLLAVWLTVFRQGGMGSAFSSVPVVELQLHPSDIQLDSAHDTQSIVVLALLENGGTFDVTRHAKISLASPSIASVQKGVILPKSDGRTELRVEHGGKTASTHVTVTGSKATKPISFRLDVMPVLTKAGCNGGNCHGTSRGKEGFHLSLFGYDPDGDHQSITRDWVGRRINLAVPEESLILEKGLGRVPHGGGERFKEGSEAYQTLLTWLRAGAPNDDTNVAHVASLEILPSQAVLLGKDSQQKLTVRAKYTDGSDRDVTRLAVLFSNNESSAKVSEDGTVQAGQQGEAFVMARFETHTVGSQIIVAPATPPEPFPELSDQNYVDKLVHAKLRKLRITPSAVCDDATFARRAYLDITGTLPTPRQLEDFVEGMSSGKREQLVDELLQREEFADLWVMKFAELLQIRSVQDQFSYKAALQYYDWLGDRLAQNVPIDQVIRALITGSGSNLQNPAANYYQVQTDTLKLAENTAQVFMGMRIQCAQCHNHPFDRWTMNDYYGFASFFARIGRKPGEDPRETIVFDRNEGEMKHPVGGRVMKPKFLGGQEAKLASEESRREALADWIASPDNPWFARNLANIVWAHFMGRGIVEPVDDVRVSNPPSNPELLDALGARFTEYKYDFRKLVRDICTSKTYQLSTHANESNRLDDRNFAKASVRRLRAEVLLDVISQVTETRDKFQGLPRGARAVEIPDGNVNNYFLRTFGRASRSTVCSCEVRTEPNLSQALHLLNGANTHGKIEQGGVVAGLIKKGRKPDEIVDELFNRCVGRKPTEEERKKLSPFLAETKDPAPALNDLFWALLNSKEFVFNH